jgi:hypothetical protein
LKVFSPFAESCARETDAASHNIATSATPNKTLFIISSWFSSSLLQILKERRLPFPRKERAARQQELRHKLFSTSI